MLIPKDGIRVKVPMRVERVGGMDFGTVIATVDDATGIPESPSRERAGVA